MDDLTHTVPLEQLTEDLELASNIVATTDYLGWYLKETLHALPSLKVALDANRRYA